ncbi:UDP-N-acetylmuramoyl-tripeptide--D-alanyl-D-alanine ligase [Oceaniglobus ichthyenteri]|uniref:UDP-N-acetylmuramoyl-tripeptide--D-alanyl-D- alanine ligase n=1 Tax=Oceaniglobus ichthyenteri TaxID=2136177 RepID=UPI000D35CA88|nr:UDP-N-acetylmuramoyl-tripeptide--D-alanyl-D-alanine ligase [Oceaniglobus ichthyenteri]
MTALWTAKEAVAATGGKSTTGWHATGVSIDTRTLQPGDLFVALTDLRDGHDFVAQALEKGAAAALVSRIPDGVAETAPLIVVDDVLAALGELGRFARARTRAQVIGVTGSVGKTSAKEMLRTVLSGQGTCHAAEASYNNHWGVPLTLARMPQDVDFAVIEIGMNHPGEIEPLAKMAAPHVALITTVTAAHLEAFDDIQGIAMEKSAIFRGLIEGGKAIVNTDLPTTEILQNAARNVGAQIIGFGRAADADYRLVEVSVGDRTTVVQARYGDQPVLFKINSQGSHFAMNALGVIAAACAVGCDPAILACDIAQWSPPAGRGTREAIQLDSLDETLSFELIDDAFNANPASMAAALEVLAASQPTQGVGRVAKGRRIAILGDMLELGPTEHALHMAIKDLPSLQDIDIVHCVGPRMKPLFDALPEEQQGHWMLNAQGLVEKAHSLVDAGDIVLVKGSKGIKVSAVVDAIRKLGHRSAKSGHAPAIKGASRVETKDE